MAPALPSSKHTSGPPQLDWGSCHGFPIALLQAHNLRKRPRVFAFFALWRWPGWLLEVAVGPAIEVRSGWQRRMLGHTSTGSDGRPISHLDMIVVAARGVLERSRCVLPYSS